MQRRRRRLLAPNNIALWPYNTLTLTLTWHSENEWFTLRSRSNNVPSSDADALYGKQTTFLVRANCDIGWYSCTSPRNPHVMVYTIQSHTSTHIRVADGRHSMHSLTGSNKTDTEQRRLVIDDWPRDLVPTSAVDRIGTWGPQLDEYCVALQRASWSPAIIVYKARLFVRSLHDFFRYFLIGRSK